MRSASVFLAVAISFLASMASAATVTISEGTRAPILGSIDLGDVKGSPSKAYDAGDFGAGDTLKIYGRMVSKVDTFAFSSAEAFSLSFIFGGFETANGTVSQSGFISAGRNANTSVFRLLDANDPTKVVGSKTFTSGIFSEAGNGGTDVIFTAAAGDYLFQVDGSVFNNRRTPALYDVQVSVVPLPASSMMLIVGLGAFAALRRKARSA